MFNQLLANPFAAPAAAAAAASAAPPPPPPPPPLLTLDVGDRFRIVVANQIPGWSGMNRRTADCLVTAYARGSAVTPVAQSIDETASGSDGGRTRVKDAPALPCGKVVLLDKEGSRGARVRAAEIDLAAFGVPWSARALRTAAPAPVTAHFSVALSAGWQCFNDDESTARFRDRGAGDEQADGGVSPYFRRGALRLPQWNARGTAPRIVEYDADTFMDSSVLYKAALDRVADHANKEKLAPIAPATAQAALLLAGMRTTRTTPPTSVLFAATHDERFAVIEAQRGDGLFFFDTDENSDSVDPPLRVLPKYVDLDRVHIVPALNMFVGLLAASMPGRQHERIVLLHATTGIRVPLSASDLGAVFRSPDTVISSLAVPANAATCAGNSPHAHLFMLRTFTSSLSDLESTDAVAVVNLHRRGSVGSAIAQTLDGPTLNRIAGEPPVQCELARSFFFWTRGRLAMLCSLFSKRGGRDSNSRGFAMFLANESSGPTENFIDFALHQRYEPGAPAHQADQDLSFAASLNGEFFCVMGHTNVSLFRVGALAAAGARSACAPFASVRIAPHSPLRGMFTSNRRLVVYLNRSDARSACASVAHCVVIDFDDRSVGEQLGDAFALGGGSDHAVAVSEGDAGSYFLVRMQSGKTETVNLLRFVARKA
jgi:hypothetical protein